MAQLHGPFYRRVLCGVLGLLLPSFPPLPFARLDLRHPEPFSRWAGRGHSSQLLFPPYPTGFLLLSNILVLIQAL